MKVYLVYARLENKERVVHEVFTEKEQAEAYINYWNNRQENVLYWSSEKETNQNDWIKTEKLLRESEQQ